MPRGRPRVSDPTLSLDSQLSYDRVAKLADATALTAGQELFRHGAVQKLSVNGDRVTASVIEGETGHVTLTAAKDGPEYDCTCLPFVETGEFCKHCVAVAFAYQSEHLGVQTVVVAPKAAVVRKPRRNRAATIDDLRDWLQGRESHELIGLILNHAQIDIEWRKTLLLTVAADVSATSGVDMPTLKKAVLSATKLRGNLDSAKMKAYLRQIEEIAEVLRQLSDRSEWSAVQELALYAITLLTEKLDNSYDSRGQLHDFIRGLVTLHRDACIEFPPEPDALAHLLYDNERLDRNGLWSDPTERYADALGKEGKAEYRRQLETEWANVPALLPGEGHHWGILGSRRRKLAAYMESFAIAANDTSGLITVMERDLSAPDRFYQIVAVCREAGRIEEAIRWAERGVAAFGANTDVRLIDFLVGEYGKRAQHDKALSLLWKRFESDNTVANFHSLHDYTEPQGQWATWRERAIGTVRKSMAEDKAKSIPSYMGRREPIGSTLVAIHLWEGALESAWQVAQSDGCSDELWIALLRAYETDHADDAIAAYRRHIPAMLERHADVMDVIQMIKPFKGLLLRLGQQGKYDTFIVEIRAAYKRRRNFMGALDNYGL